MNRIAFNALFTLSVRHGLSSRLDINRFFIVCIAGSTAPVPVCNLRVLYSILIFRDLQKSIYSFDMNAPLLSVLIFSWSPYKLKFWLSKFSTSFVSDYLQIFTVGHLLNLSTGIISWYSPYNFLFQCPAEINMFFFVSARLMFLIFRFHFSVFGNLNSYSMPCRLHNVLFGLPSFCGCFATRISGLRQAFC